MTHDPLCPVVSTEAEIYWRPKCPYCTLIARVRQEEQGNCDENIGIASVRAHRFGYAAALSDAVEAITGLHAYDDNGALKPFSPDTAVVYRTAALAAIKALGINEA